jgi:ribosomal protein S21
MGKIINASVTLNKQKCTDKAYFDKMYIKFSREFLKSGVLDELRLKKRYYKPSALKKIKKQLFRNKWKYYN